MNDKSKFRIMSALAVCVIIALAAQSYYLFGINARLEKLQQSAVSVPTSSLDELFQPDPSTTATSAPWSGFGWPDPFTSLDQIQKDLDSWFNNWPGSSGIGSPRGFSFSTSTPDIELNESKDDYEIVVQVPQNTEVDLRTDVEDDVVTVRGTMNQETGSNAGNLASSFTAHSQFTRSIRLPGPVDPLAMHTDRDGEKIIITLPKAS